MTWFNLRITVGILVAFSFVFTFVVTGAPNAEAANRSSQKVTICHRTHSTTNPYRQITVSINSITRNNGHDDAQHNKDNDPDFPKYADNTPVRVFDPSFNYAPNAKMWGDIIPSFFYTTNSGTAYFPGRNWTEAGKAIYYGLGDRAGLCGTVGPKEAAQAEFDEWLADYPALNGGQQPNSGEITSKKRSIINDLKDQENDGENLSRFDADLENLPSEAKKPKGAKRPTRLNDLLSQLAAQNQSQIQNAEPNLNQALAGVVWKDTNSNGVQEDSEQVFGSLGIQIIDTSTGQALTPQQLSQIALVSRTTKAKSGLKTKAAEKPIFSFASSTTKRNVFRTSAALATLYTDADGYFEVPSLPAGDWQVSVITPSGWSYTYDSSGSSDGAMPDTYVPAGGLGFAWAGLTYVGTNSSGSGGSSSETAPGTSGKSKSSSNSLAKSGPPSQSPVMVLVGGATVVTGICLVFWAYRRKPQLQTSKREP